MTVSGGLHDRIGEINRSLLSDRISILNPIDFNYELILCQQ